MLAVESVPLFKQTEFQVSLKQMDLINVLIKFPKKKKSSCTLSIANETAV